MVSFTFVVFAAIAASIANTSPIPFSNSGPARMTEAGLLPVYTPGSPVRSKTSEDNDTCEDLGNKAMDETRFAYNDKDESPAKRTSSLMNTARCRQDGSPQPSGPGFAGPPQPQSETVSALNSAVDHQQVMKDHGPDAASAAESAAHYRQYRMSHGLDTDESDSIKTEKSGEYKTGGQASGNLTRQSASSSPRAGRIRLQYCGWMSLCKVKGDAESIQTFEASLVEPNIPTHMLTLIEGCSV